MRCRTSRAAAEDSEATRALYPFAFRLVVTYTFDEAGLDVALKIVNTGEETLPASVGGHPFNWPLQPGRPKESYAPTFANKESFRFVVSMAGGAEASQRRGASPLRIAVHRRRRHLRSQQHFCPLCGWAGTVAGNVLVRLSRARHLVKAVRRPVLMHRAVAGLCQPRDLRRRVQRQAALPMHSTSGAEGLLVYSLRCSGRRGRP